MKTYVPHTPMSRSSQPLLNDRNLLTPRCQKTYSRMNRTTANDSVRRRLIFDESPPPATSSDVTLCSIPEVEPDKKSRYSVCSSTDSGIQTPETTENVRTAVRAPSFDEENRSVAEIDEEGVAEKKRKKRAKGSPKSVLKKKVCTSARTQGLVDCDNCNTPKSRNIREGTSLSATDTIAGATLKHRYNLRKRKPDGSVDYSWHLESATDNVPPTCSLDPCARMCDDSALGNDSLSDEFSYFGI